MPWRAVGCRSLVQQILRNIARPIPHQYSEMLPTFLAEKEMVQPTKIQRGERYVPKLSNGFAYSCKLFGYGRSEQTATFSQLPAGDHQPRHSW